MRSIVARRPSSLEVVEEVGKVELVFAQVGMGVDAVKNGERRE